ncbi:hypothetical protein ACXZ1K_12890 [Pedobacter sp. PWIIR3]
MHYLHHSIKEEKPYYKEIIDSYDLESVFVVKAMLDNARILKQQGLFMIFGMYANKLSPASIPLEWVLNKIKTGLKLTIKASDKQNIIRQLEINGISKSTLFPEIEHQGSHLKNTYSFKK